MASIAERSRDASKAVKILAVAGAAFLVLSGVAKIVEASSKRKAVSGGVAATATAVAAVRATRHPPVQVRARVVASRHLMIVSEVAARHLMIVSEALENTIRNIYVVGTLCMCTCPEN